MDRDSGISTSLGHRLLFSTSHEVESGSFQSLAESSGQKNAPWHDKVKVLSVIRSQRL